jgi:hypothetical protein
MAPSDILALAVFGAAGLYVSCRFVICLADRVIDAVDSLTRFER